MTSPPEQVEVECPSCGTTYEGWYRASINMMIEDWTDEELREATTATCPSCSHTVHFGGLIVREDGVFEFEPTGPR